MLMTAKIQKVVRPNSKNKKGNPKEHCMMYIPQEIVQILHLNKGEIVTLEVLSETEMVVKKQQPFNNYHI